MSREQNRALVTLAVLALVGIVYAAWRTLEPPRADRDLVAPAAPPATERGPEIELLAGDAARIRAHAREREGLATRDRSLASVEHQRSVDSAELVLVRGATLRGFVHDRDGAPIEAARIDALAREADSALRAATASNTDGSFELVDAPSGLVQVSAQLDDGRRSVASVTVEVEPGGILGGIELVVPIYADSNAILGLVLDVDGSPLAGAPVRFLRTTATAVSFLGTQLTDERGRFRHQGRPGASFRITAEHPRGAAVAAHAEGVEPGFHDVVLR